MSSSPGASDHWVGHFQFLQSNRACTPHTNLPARCSYHAGLHASRHEECAFCGSKVVLNCNRETGINLLHRSDDLQRQVKTNAFSRPSYKYLSSTEKGKPSFRIRPPQNTSHQCPPISLQMYLASIPDLHRRRSPTLIVAAHHDPDHLRSAPPAQCSGL